MTKCPYCETHTNLFTQVFEHINETHQSIIERKIMLDVVVVNEEVLKK